MKRQLYLKEIALQLEVHKVCGLLGPRQVGKTTLAMQFAEKFNPGQVHSFDMEHFGDVIKFDNPTGEGSFPIAEKVTSCSLQAFISRKV